MMQPKRLLSRMTLARVFGRSLFIQAGFNTESLQTLGLVYALEPALKELYPSPDAEQAQENNFDNRFIFCGLG